MISSKLYTIEFADLTSSNLMDFMLYEKVYERYKSAEEGTGQIFPIFDSFTVVWAQCYASQGPWQGRNYVRYHEYVMPVMIICRGNICPSTACEGSK